MTRLKRVAIGVGMVAVGIWAVATVASCLAVIGWVVWLTVS
jgi:hypothetical protein